MNLSSRRQLPNEKIRQFTSTLINTENDIQYPEENVKSLKQTRFSLRNNEDGISTFQRNKYVRTNDESYEQGRLRYQDTKQPFNDRDGLGKMSSSKQDAIMEKVLQSRFDRRLQEIEQNRNERQRKLSRPYDENTTSSPIRTHSTQRTYESQLKSPKRRYEENETTNIAFSPQNSATLRECAKTIRESVCSTLLEEFLCTSIELLLTVIQFTDELMRKDVPREKQISKDEELLTILNRRRKTEQNSLQLENEYLIQRQTYLSKSAALNEMLNFKKELEKNERQREQLSEQLEKLMKTCNEKEKLISKTSFQIKEVTENCDTFERQNNKLQQDLRLALERLEEMTAEAERFAQESNKSQKQLADSEQKREEFQIQAQETIKQWKARVQKLEKEIERSKMETTQMSEKNDQLIKEIDNSKIQHLTLREQITTLETDLNESNKKYNRLEDLFKRKENDIVQLHATRTSQEGEIATLKGTINELKNQLSGHRHRLSQLDLEKQDVQQLLQEEINHRNTSDSKVKQYEKDIETLNTSRSQLQHQMIKLGNEQKNLLHKIKGIEHEKESLLEERIKFVAIEKDYHDIKQKLEATKSDYTRGIRALQKDYDKKIETIQVQLSDEKARSTVLQRHELEHKKEIEKLQEKSTKFEDDGIQKQHTIDIISREIHDKTRSISELESKITKMTVEITNQKNQLSKKDKDYQNSLQTVYDDILICTECLSNDSKEPFFIEPAITPRDNIEVWLSKFKAHLAWLKQELEIRQEEEKKLRQDLKNTLLDCEADRTYFASELTKRENIINKFTHGHQTTNEYSTFDIQVEYNRHRIMIEDERDHIDNRYQQFQTMIDSVKRELQTAKVQLST